MDFEFIINTDGASRGNPGPSAASFLIQDKKGKILVSEGRFLGIATNNEAEYTAVKISLEKLYKSFHPHLPAKVLLKADSLLVINQLSGRFKIKNPRIKVFIYDIRKLEGKIGEIKYIYIPRLENYSADKLANLTLDRR